MRTLVLAASLAGFCAVAPQPGGASGSVLPVAEPAANIDNQVNAADDDLAQASRAVNALLKQLNETRTKLPVAKARLNAANAAVFLGRRNAESAQAAVAAAEVAAVQARGQAEAISVQIAQIRELIAVLARDVYMSGGNFEEMQVLLDARSPAEFAERLASLKMVSRRNSQLLQRMNSAQQELSKKLVAVRTAQDTARARRADAAQHLAEAANSLRAAEAAQAEVSRLVAERQKAVAGAARHRRAVKAMYDQLRAEQRRIAAEARAALERERERQRERDRQKNQNGNNGDARPNGGTSPGSSEPDPVLTPTGELLWPLPGKAPGGRTGSRIHPIYGYRSCHTGDDISASSGTPIHAAAAGTVILVSSGGAYGNNVLISHSDGLSTMYAHQSRVAVQEGQLTAKGDVIGYVGSTGYSTGPHLHFEIHVNGTPYEPMGWFGYSKHPVSCWSG